MRTIVARYLGALLMGISATVGLSAQSGPVNYVYDELGRLVAVIDGTGARAVYIYDAVGNLTSIERYASGTVSIIEFTPNSGPVGTAVTISGTGFSTTPSQNTLTFNGVAATVTASTATQLSATVPTGATTGPIAVTTPSGSASSSTSFVVASTAPTITSFTPQIGVAGAAVTINGTNFSATAANNSVKFNVSYATVSSSSTTAISTVVPSQTGSGPISVATPAGVATGGDFFVPPSPYVATDVEFTGRPTPGQSITVSITAANKIGLVVIDLAVGHGIFVNSANETFTNVSGCDVLVGLRKTDGTALGSDTCLENGAIIDTRIVSTTGTYTLVVDPGSTATGSITLTPYDVVHTTGTITPGGSAVTVTTTMPGQNGLLTFTGAANQRVSVLATNETYTNVTLCDVWVRLRKPDGTDLGYDQCVEDGDFIDVRTLPVAGTYTAIVDPSSTTTGSVTITLYDVPADPTGSITPGGSAVTVTTTTPGQNALLTFTGAANQRVSIIGTNETMTNVPLCDVRVGIQKPDGTDLGTYQCMDGGGFMDVRTLPVAGTYTVVVDPLSSATGSLTVTLYDVPADVTGTLTIGGGAVPVTVTTPGQNGALTFSGTQNQQVTVHITGNTMGIVIVKLLKPDQSQLTSKSSGLASFDLTTQTLPTTGTYTVTIDPSGTNTGTLNVSVTSP